MICRQRRIIESPPLQVVKVPLRHGQMVCYFHPVSLRFVIAMHWGILVSCALAIVSHAVCHPLDSSLERLPPTHQNTSTGPPPSARGQRPSRRAGESPIARRNCARARAAQRAERRDARWRTGGRAPAEVLLAQGLCDSAVAVCAERDSPSPLLWLRACLEHCEFVRLEGKYSTCEI